MTSVRCHLHSTPPSAAWRCFCFHIVSFYCGVYRPCERCDKGLRSKCYWWKHFSAAPLSVCHWRSLTITTATCQSFS